MTLPRIATEGGAGELVFFLTAAHCESIPLLQFTEGDKRGAAPLNVRATRPNDEFARGFGRGRASAQSAVGAGIAWQNFARLGLKQADKWQ